MILDKVIKVKISSRTFKYYKDKGYDVKMNKTIDIDINDLSKGSNIEVNVKCDICGIEKTLSYKTYNLITFNNTSNYFCSKCKIIKTSETNLERYGVENVFQSKEIKEKIKDTNLERYDVISYSKTDDFKLKTEKTNLEKYGVVSYSKTDECKLKIKQTKLEKYGDENYINKEKMISTIRNNEKKLIVQKAKNIHGDKYSYELITDYKNMNTYEKIICPIHGSFSMKMKDHIHSKNGCPKCRESKGEKAIRIYLETNNIKYESQKRFEECIDKNTLPFDFYLPEYNVCIEYDGEQHFKAIKYFGGEKKFKETQNHDLIKKNYCEKNNIKLIRFRFDDLDFERLNIFI